MRAFKNLPSSESQTTQISANPSVTETDHSKPTNAQQTHHRFRKFLVFAILGLALVAFMLLFQRRESGKAKTSKPVPN
jgi:hypothetical protein